MPTILDFNPNPQLYKRADLIQKIDDAISKYSGGEIETIGIETLLAGKFKYENKSLLDVAPDYRGKNIKLYEAYSDFWNKFDLLSCFNPWNERLEFSEKISNNELQFRFYLYLLIAKDSYLKKDTWGTRNFFSAVSNSSLTSVTNSLHALSTKRKGYCMQFNKFGYYIYNLTETGEKELKNIYALTSNRDRIVQFQVEKFIDGVYRDFKDKKNTRNGRAYDEPICKIKSARLEIDGEIVSATINHVAGEKDMERARTYMRKLANKWL